MKKFLLSLSFILGLLAMPQNVFAQEAEEETPPVDLTIGFSVVSPSSVAFDKAPTEYKLDFNNSGLKILSVIDNTTLTSDEASPAKYAYLEYVLNDVTAQSAPLTASIADGVVTLTADLSKSPDFAALLNSEGYYNLNLVVPYGLFTVKAMNIVNKVNDYLSLDLTTTYVHAGNAQIIKFNSEPATGSTIEKLSKVQLSLPIPANIIAGGHWVTLTNADPTVYTRYEGQTDWNENGFTVLDFDETDPSKITLTVRPGMSTKGQYRIDFPVGTMSLTKYSDETKQNVEACYVTANTSLRFAIGEEVESSGMPKGTILANVAPAEGDINLTDYPSGVEYLQLTFTEIPVLNRTINQNIKLYYNGGETPLREVNPLNETVFRLQTQGISNDYGHVVNLWFDYGESNFDAPGDYTVEFPGGLFLFGEMKEPNAPFTLNYHINKTLTYSIYPKNQSTVDDIETITINFCSAQSITPSETAETDITLSSLSTTPVHPKISVDGKIVRLNFEKITEAHVYTLSIPAGAFNATIDNEILPNQPMEFLFTVSLLPIPTVTPAEGILPSNTLYDITLDLGDDAEITGIIDNSYNRLLRVDDNGEIVYTPVVSYYKYEEPVNAIGSSLVTLIPKNETPLTLSPGNYVFITTRYLYTLKGGDTANEYFYYFTVLPELPELPKPGITPWDNVVSASHFTLTLPETEIISALSDNVSYIYPKNEDGSLGEVAARYYVSRSEKSNMVDLISIDNPELKPGVYQLSTPKALFRTSTAVAAPYDFEIFYGISSVIDASADNENFNVYTFDGIRILDNASAEALKNLPAGFYIVNGKKKVIVK